MKRGVLSVLEPNRITVLPSLSLSHKFYCCQENFTVCMRVCMHARVLFLYARIYQMLHHDRICASGLQTLLLHIRNLLYLFGEWFILTFQSQPTLLTGFQTQNFRDS